MWRNYYCSLLAILLNETGAASIGWWILNFWITRPTFQRTCSPQKSSRGSSKGCAPCTPTPQSSGPRADTSCSCSLHRHVLWIRLAIADNSGRQNPVSSLIRGPFASHHKYWCQSLLQPGKNTESRKKAGPAHVQEGRQQAPRLPSSKPDKYP